MTSQDAYYHGQLAQLVQHIKNGAIKRILLVTGAGLSTSAGIPDFRTPGTGLYDNLQRYNLPRPTSIFELEYFKGNPEPFFRLSQELMISHDGDDEEDDGDGEVNVGEKKAKYRPTVAHYFIRLLFDKGLLLRNYTQNIDGLEFLTFGTSDTELERMAGGVVKDEIEEKDGENSEGNKGSSSAHFLDTVIQCHGSYRTAHCIQCRQSYTMKEVKQLMKKPSPPNATANCDDSHENLSVRVTVPYCTSCNKENNIVKPDIVMFGEALPDAFFKNLKSDVMTCDCVIVMGTSLAVYPVAGILSEVLFWRLSKSCLGKDNYVCSVLFNRERVGPFESSSLEGRVEEERDRFLFVGEPYSIDDAVELLVKELGWEDELKLLMKQ